MVRSTHRAIAEQVSGQNALGYVAAVAQHHRIQSSPGFRAAAAFAADVLAAAGLAVETLRFPADGNTFTWTSIVPQEWRLRSAELRLVEPAAEARTLASTLDAKLAVIQRSVPTPPDGVAGKLVVIEGGDAAEDYADVEVRGCFVLSDRPAQAVHRLAVVDRGALGVIFDGLAAIPAIRPRGDLPDALQYTSFWWVPGEPRGFGFVLSPRAGARLRALARRSPIWLQARVDAAFVDGTMECVTATLPGTDSTDEVLVVTHLCHPQPSANDNASGVGATLEAARALAAAIRAGSLSRPRRTVRFLLPAEMMGTYAYLAGDPERVRRAVAGLNLDMVGENQDLCGSTLTIERPPLASPGWVADLLERLVQFEARAGGHRPFRHTAAPFNGGSDHYILADPTVGIPCPMIIQWPDRFYHTSLDTLDKVDPDQLARAARLAATYAHVIAAADPATVRWLASESIARWTISALALAQDAATDGRPLTELEAAVLLRAESTRASLRALARLEALTVQAHLGDWLDAVDRAAAAALDHARPFLPAAPAAETGGAAAGSEADLERVPRRLVPGPISAHGLTARLDPSGRARLAQLERRGGRDAGRQHVLAVYWCDGARSLREIAELVAAESGSAVDRARLVEYFDLLAAAGFVDWAPIAAGVPADN